VKTVYLKITVCTRATVRANVLTRVEIHRVPATVFSLSTSRNVTTVSVTAIAVMEVIRFYILAVVGFISSA